MQRGSAIVMTIQRAARPPTVNEQRRLLNQSTTLEYLTVHLGTKSAGLLLILTSRPVPVLILQLIRNGILRNRGDLMHEHVYVANIISRISTNSDLQRSNLQYHNITSYTI